MMYRIFLDWGEAGALMFFDVPSILMGLFAGIIITNLFWLILSVWRNRHDKRNVE